MIAISKLKTLLRQPTLIIILNLILIRIRSLVNRPLTSSEVSAFRLKIPPTSDELDPTAMEVPSRHAKLSSVVNCTIVP